MDDLQVRCRRLGEREPVDGDLRLLIAGGEVEVVPRGVHSESHDAAAPRTAETRVGKPELRLAAAGWYPPDDRLSTAVSDVERPVRAERVERRHIGERRGRGGGNGGVGLAVGS